MSDIMTETEVRILLPLEHRLTVDDNVQRWPREEVITTHRVIDPMGLKTIPHFQSISTVTSGGTCGYTPSLGVLAAVTTWHGRDDALPQTSYCTTSNAAFAAEYQTTGKQRTIPDMNTCYDQSTSDQWILMTDLNPNCEFYGKDGDLPLWKNFDCRMDRAYNMANQQPGRIDVLQNDELSWIPNTDAKFPTDLRRIIGKPILSKIGVDGTHSFWVFVLEDFDQFLPELMRVDIPPQKLRQWATPLVGPSRTFYVNQNGKIVLVNTPPGIDPVIFEIIMGDSLPPECGGKWSDQSDNCLDLQRAYYQEINSIESSGIKADTLAGIWERLPAPLVSTAKP